MRRLLQFVGHTELGHTGSLWDTLEARLKEQNHTRRLSLRRELIPMKRQQAETLSMYLSRAQQLRNDLQGADQDIGEDEVMCAVLSGLPSRYDDVAVAIMEQSNRALTIDGCLSTLLGAGISNLGLTVPNVQMRITNSRCVPSDSHCDQLFG
jgi:hypothetical protein